MGLLIRCGQASPGSMSSRQPVPSPLPRLSLKTCPQLRKPRFSLGGDRPTEIEENLESRSASLVEELNAAGGSAVKVAGLLHSESCRQFLPPDVHVEGVSLDVEELAGHAESAELSVKFDRRRTIGHQHAHRTHGLKTTDQLLPSSNVKFHDPIRGKSTNDLDLRHAKVTGQLQGH